jgi:hypothetical protein
VQTSDAGSYSVVATNSAGNAPSNAALLTVLPAGTSATHAVVGTGYTTGGTVTITNTITYVGTATGLGWQVLLPDGWSFASGSDTPGQTKPAVGATTAADTDRDWKLSLAELTRVIELYNTRNGTVRTGRYKVQAGTEDGFAQDTTATANQTLTQYHSADSNRDGQISLNELTRVIDLYNTRAGTVRTGQYHVQAGTEDGFAPGP